jgi:hypothetical protein
MSYTGDREEEARASVGVTIVAAARFLSPEELW